MAPGPRTPVLAPIARPPRLGLVAQAPVIEDGTRWENGYEFVPEGCHDGGVGDPCDSQDFDPEARRPMITTDPFLVWAGDRCTTIGMDETELRARARRQLEATQSFRIAHELWTGDQAESSGWTWNKRFATTDSDTVTEGPVTPTDALACLEQYLGVAQAGQQGMIHATRQVVTYWIEKYLVTRQGGQLVTALDTIVVPDAGYDGSAPDGSPAANGSIWAYATGIVQVRLGSVELGPPEDAPNAAFRYLENDVAYVAWRVASATWDGCALGAAEIDLDLCPIGGAS